MLDQYHCSVLAGPVAESNEMYVPVLVGKQFSDTGVGDQDTTCTKTDQSAASTDDGDGFCGRGNNLSSVSSCIPSLICILTAPIKTRA